MPIFAAAITPPAPPLLLRDAADAAIRYAASATLYDAPDCRLRRHAILQLMMFSSPYAFRRFAAADIHLPLLLLHITPLLLIFRLFMMLFRHIDAAMPRHTLLLLRHAAMLRLFAAC